MRLRFLTIRVRLTRYGLAVTILTGIIFAGQLYEMISGGTQTDKLIRYARTQANAASDQADAAQQFSDTTEDINGRMSDAVEQLEAAAKNAKASIEATQKSFRADQRAWVGLGEAQILQFNAKDALKLAVPMVDTGKSPAVSTEGALKYLVTSAYRKGPPINAQYLFKPASAVPPQGRYVFNVTQAGISDSYDAITSGTKFLYIYGVFRYRDVYDPAVARVTTFCLFYDITYKGMAFCETGNGMN
jgi:hypothetical protein